MLGKSFEKAIKVGDIFLFLSMVLTVNFYIRRKLNATPRSHSEGRELLRKMGREDLRAVYNDVMKILHDEAFYDGVYN